MTRRNPYNKARQPWKWHIYESPYQEGDDWSWAMYLPGASEMGRSGYVHKGDIQDGMPYGHHQLDLFGDIPWPRKSRKARGQDQASI